MNSGKTEPCAFSAFFGCIIWLEYTAYYVFIHTVAIVCDSQQYKPSLFNIRERLGLIFSNFNFRQSDFNNTGLLWQCVIGICAQVHQYLMYLRAVCNNRSARYVDFLANING